MYNSYKLRVWANVKEIFNISLSINMISPVSFQLAKIPIVLFFDKEENNKFVYERMKRDELLLIIHKTRAINKKKKKQTFF